MTQYAVGGRVVLNTIVVTNRTDLAAPFRHPCDFVSMAASAWHVCERECVGNLCSTFMTRKAGSRWLVMSVVTGLAQRLRWADCG